MRVWVLVTDMPILRFCEGWLIIVTPSKTSKKRSRPFILTCHNCIRNLFSAPADSHSFSLWGKPETPFAWQEQCCRSTGLIISLVRDTYGVSTCVFDQNEGSSAFMTRCFWWGESLLWSSPLQIASSHGLLISFLNTRNELSPTLSWRKKHFIRFQWQTFPQDEPHVSFRRLQLIPLLQELAGGASALDTRLPYRGYWPI